MSWITEHDDVHVCHQALHSVFVNCVMDRLKYAKNVCVRKKEFPPNLTIHHIGSCVSCDSFSQTVLYASVILKDSKLLQGCCMHVDYLLAKPPFLQFGTSWDPTMPLSYFTPELLENLIIIHKNIKQTMWTLLYNNASPYHTGHSRNRTGNRYFTVGSHWVLCTWSFL